MPLTLTDWQGVNLHSELTATLTAAAQSTCTAKGMQVDSFVLLASVPIVPVPAPQNHKVGYIVGPVLAVLVIFAFFGALAWLQMEKSRDIRCVPALGLPAGFCAR
jgi:hypothetical protein